MSESQSNLDIVASYFADTSFQLLGLMNIDSGNLDIQKLHIHSLNFQSQAVFSIDCYSDVSLSVDEGIFDQLGFYVNNSVTLEPLYRSGVFDISSQVDIDAINPEGCNHRLTITNSTFDQLFSNSNATVLNNRAPTTCTLNFTSNLFQELKSSKGAAINSVSSDVATLIYLRNNSFQDNQAFKYGGCIYNVNNTLDIQNCTFANNIAVYSGGAIYSESITKASSLKKSNYYINNRFQVQHESLCCRRLSENNI